MMKTKLMPILAGVIALSAVAAPFAVQAQSIHSGGQRLVAQGQSQEHQGKRAQLNLTDAQKQQMRQIQKDTHDQIQGVLTQEQQDKLKTLMQNRQGQNRQGQNHQKGQDVMAQLNLSDDQKAKIKEIMQTQKSRMDGVLTAEQRQQMQQMHQQWQQQRQQRQQGNQ